MLFASSQYIGLIKGVPLFNPGNEKQWSIMIEKNVLFIPAVYNNKGERLCGKGDSVGLCGRRVRIG